LTGPTRLKNGSLPKLFVRNCVMSFGPGVSLAIATCTASFTNAELIPTSSGFLCCQSSRSGKYVGCACAMAAGRGKVGDRRGVCATAGAMTSVAKTSGSARRSMGYLLAKAAV
jgi:hypothetical protein